MPVEAVRRLVEAACASALEPHPLDLLDLDVAATEARRFKLDVSFALMADGGTHARISINDKGEPIAFRDRARAHLPVPPSTLDGFFALSPPGQVQTTVSVKWNGSSSAPARVGLYYEELSLYPDGATLIHRVFRFGLGRDAPVAPERTSPVAVCLDVAGGKVVAAKDYHMVTERDGMPHPGLELPEVVRAVRDGLPLHTVNGTRRYLVARRFVPNASAPVGTKLLWMTECHRPETVSTAWARVDALRSSLSLGGGEALDALRAEWPFKAKDVYLYPDLVCINADRTGRLEGLILYVSVK